MTPAPTESLPQPLPLPERLERVREVLEDDPAQALVLLRDFLTGSTPHENAHATLLSARALSKGAAWGSARSR